MAYLGNCSEFGTYGLPEELNEVGWDGWVIDIFENLAQQILE